MGGWGSLFCRWVVEACTPVLTTTTVCGVHVLGLPASTACPYLLCLPMLLYCYPVLSETDVPVSSSPSI